MSKQQWSRVFHCLVALLTLSAIVVGGSQVAKAEAGGYPYAHFNGPGSNSTQSYWTDAGGNHLSPYRYVYRNCTDFVAWKLDTVNGWKAKNTSGASVSIGNAANWGVWAANNGYTVDRTPSVGSVAWWNGSAGYGSWGHVAYVASVSADGNTVGLQEYNWPVNNGFDGAYHTRNVSKMQPSGYIHFKDLPASGTPGNTNPIADSKFVSYRGAVYRIAGGAPLYVSGQDAAHPDLAGWAKATAITDAQWASLRPFPADGTYLSDVQTGAVYVTLGGAPMYISGADAPLLPKWASATRVPHWDFVHWQRLRQYPADGHYLSDVQTGAVYNTAGGAPFYIAGEDTAALPHWQYATPVPHWEFVNFQHLRPFPADGMYINDVRTGAVYVTLGGAPMYISGEDTPHMPNWAGATRVSHWEFQNWSHLRQHPADGHYLRDVQTNAVYVTAGGAPLYVTAEHAPLLPQWRYASPVPHWELQNRTHLQQLPADGTYVKGVPSNKVFRVVNGAAHIAPDGPLPPLTTVDDWAIVNQLGGTV